MGDQREIKFRAFLKKEKLMLRVKSIDFETRKVTLLEVVVDTSPDREMPADSIGECMHDQVQKFEDIVLMQFTGLSDSSGDDIYDGDILKTNEHIDTVIWRYDLCGFSYRNDKSRLNLVDWLEHGQYAGSKIIGNIYQDKEKMKDED